MTSQAFRLRLTRVNQLKLKVSARVPAQIEALTPIVLEKTNGAYTLSLDANALSGTFATAAQGALADTAVQSVVAGTNVSVDNTDPKNPVVSAIGSGSGDVTGPASATDGHIPQFDGTTGKLLKDGKAAPSGTIVGTTDSQTLTNKTLTAPAISSPTGIVKADVGLGNVDNTSDATKWAATATLTNKTYDTAGTGNSFSINGVAVTANTGTGAVARAASPTFTGTPAAPTAAVDTNTTQIATTAMVLAQAASATPLADGTAAVGTSTRFARADHVHPANTSRNRVVNPSGQIAQSGATGTVADGAYGLFDQWVHLNQSNPVTPSQLTNVENTTPYMMRTTQSNASAQRFGLIQPIESVNCIDLRGQSVTLQARVRCSASTTLRYAIVEWTGTADSVTKDVVNDWTNATFTTGNFFISTTTTIVATGSTALTSNTLATVSLTGTVSGSMNNLHVFFWTDSTQAQNVTLDIGKVQLEAGSSASPFVVRSYSEEFLLCLRYYWRQAPNAAFAPFASGFNISTTQMLGYMRFPTPMRVAPSVSTAAAGNMQVLQGGSGFTLTGFALDAPDIFGTNLLVTTSGLTAGSASLVRTINTSGDMILNARL